MKAFVRCGRRWAVAVALAGVLALGAGEVQAGTIYVAPSGSDANDGLGWSTAKLTVQAGLNAAVAGSQVWVAAGTYVGCVTLKAEVALYGGFAGTETDLSERDWTANLTILDGNQLATVVTVAPGATLSTRIDGFAIRNGNGGIYCTSASPTIANNTITANAGSLGGGICCYYNASPAITNNIISANTASTYGGGIYCYSYSASYPCSPRIIGNTITGNSTRNDGGGIACSGGGTPIILNNTITSNTATANGGGIFCCSSSPPIANNTIAGNVAANGGGIYCVSSCTSTIANNTILGNTARVAGGAIYCYYSPMTIANSIIAFNSSGIYAYIAAGIDPPPTLRSNCFYNNVDYNVAGMTDPTGVNGNITADPCLAGYSYRGGNVHIQPDSPCIDAGDNSVLQPGWHDMDNQDRVLHDHVDIGADESDGTLWSDEPRVTIRVSPAGDDANDGSSWPLAKRTVQAAIDAASAVGGDIWVQAGTYTGQIALRPFAHLYGGFAGTETRRDERNPSCRITILDGAGATGVVVAKDIPPGVSTIDGFHICNGLAGGIGGGISCDHASPVIANNTIAGNAITGSYACGGGIYCSFSSPMILNNTIVGNVASASSGYGGGIYCSNSCPTIANNTILANTTSGSGGALYCASSSPAVLNNTIVDNVANAGGGIYFSSLSSANVVNNIVAYNSSGVRSDGMGRPSFRSNCVYGNGASNYLGLTDPTGTAGNISVDPGFASRAFGNLHIQPGSPCIEAGEDAVLQPAWTDKDGQPRRQGVHIDIGADESDGVAWPEGSCAVIRVSPDGDDANDGFSWPLAKRTVQAAIVAAVATGGEVWVRAGTYIERITLRPYVHLYGGFAGTEPIRAARDIAAHGTVLDGARGGSVVTASQLRPGLATLDGFTIRNGGWVESPSTTFGGGISCSKASPIIANNTITLSTATNGGGIYCGSTSSPIIVGNTITGNTADAGGGIYCDSSSPTIANNAITGNAGYSYAGGIYCRNSSPQIVNNTIVGNTGNFGGGIYTYSSSPLIANTIIAFNSSGLRRSGGSLTLLSNCVYGNGASNYFGLTDPTGTNGNISVDPALAAVSYRNVHIQPGSPCIDVGNDTQVRPEWLDVDGQPRVLSGHVDIGADESDGMLWPAVPGSIVRVAPDGNDVNDGSSWTLPKRTVQAGIDAAAAGGGEVWVRAGTYVECIRLRAFAHVYGGFDGTETSRSARDFARSAAILDGARAGSVVTAEPMVAGIARLDGFTVRNGKGELAGGICCEMDAAPTIANNTITRNAGLGVACYDSSPAITNNTITGNLGTGIVVSGVSSPRIVNNTITGNCSADAGGIICGPTSAPVILNTIVAFNSSGVLGDTAAAISLRHNCVYGNEAFDYSGFEDPTGTDGNMSVDPRLARPFYADVHIQPDSPCVDAGDDSVVQADETDLDGQPRRHGSCVDIGADESDGALWPSGSPVVVRVSPLGNDANGGSSWLLAKRTIQAGLDAAAPSGGQVWVAAGTYIENISLPMGVALYGGFAMGQTDLSQRGGAGNETILDGNQAGSVVTPQSGVGRTTRIDGFTIRNGTGTDVYNGRYGGGVYCYSASPSIANCIIAGNTASWGGGIYCASSSPAILACTVKDNSAAASGGGICCSYSSPMISDCTIKGNTATGSAGIACSSATITRTLITDNTASDAGGGLSCGSGSIVTDNTIARNAASSGGGIYCTGPSAKIMNNSIVGNTATDGGGGILAVSATSTIANNRLVGNVASYGGGIHVSGGSVRIVGNTIVGNIAVSGMGGGLNLSAATGPVSNTIIAFNSSGIFGFMFPPLRANCVYGNAAYGYSGVTDPTGTDGNIAADPRFVRLPSDGGDGWGDDPATPGTDEGANDDFGDLRLLPGSFCIDAGTNLDLPPDLADLDADGDTAELLPLDLVRAARCADDPHMLDTGSGVAPVVDIGALEYHCGDATGDGHVDVVDLLRLVYAFGTCEGDAAYDVTCDFNADGTVDVVDLLDIVYGFGA